MVDSPSSHSFAFLMLPKTVMVPPGPSIFRWL
jgi:hypothetical protein